jgi:hypothetical protein
MSELGPEPLPVPDGPEPAEPQPRSRTGMVGALLCLGAAALTMIGTFQDLVNARNFSQGGLQTYVITSWTTRFENNGTLEPGSQAAPLNGVPLLISVAMLLVAAALGMLAANRPPGWRFGRLGGLAAVVGATFLAGTVATIGAQELWWLDIFGPPENAPPDPSIDTSVTVGPGFWTLAAGAGLAIVAAVTAWRRQARPEAVREEPDTPRLGIPVVVVTRLPDAPPDE